jgi:hypothetical protein
MLWVVPLDLLTSDVFTFGWLYIMGNGEILFLESTVREFHLPNRRYEKGTSFGVLLKFLAKARKTLVFQSATDKFKLPLQFILPHARQPINCDHHGQPENRKPM